MADVACFNNTCSEYEIPKSNPGGIPADEIHCGTCGGPVDDIESPDVEPEADAT